MYKKVLYNIKKIKKCGEGEGRYLNPKHSLFIKKREKKKLTEPGFEPTTSGLKIH